MSSINPAAASVVSTLQTPASTNAVSRGGGEYSAAEYAAKGKSGGAQRGADSVSISAAAVRAAAGDDE
ncbi:MAG: hypothetical protein AAGI30_13685 [Planctomycetota bacterium]